MTLSSWSWRRLVTMRTRSSFVSLPWIASVASSKLTYRLTAAQSCPAVSV